MEYFDFWKYFSWMNRIWLYGNLLLCFYNFHHRVFNFVTSINTCGMFIFLNSIFINRVIVISNFSIVKTQSVPVVFPLIYIMLFDSYVTVLFSTIHWFSLTRSKWLRMVNMGEIMNMVFTVQRPWHQLLKNLTNLNFRTRLFF